MTSDVVFLLDVDNTLLDNDGVIADMKRHLEQTFGVDSAARYWAIFEALRAGDTATAAVIRERFLEHEDLRDAWGPARVLHASMALAGIAATGPIPPFVSALSEEQQSQLRPAAIKLRG